MLDLAAVSFIDSVGISMLVRCRDELGREGGAFSLGDCSGQVEQLLELTGLSGHFSRYRPAQHGPSADLGSVDAVPDIKDPDLASGEMLRRPRLLQARHPRRQRRKTNSSTRRPT